MVLFLILVMNDLHVYTIIFEFLQSLFQVCDWITEMLFVEDVKLHNFISVLAKMCCIY